MSLAATIKNALSERGQKTKKIRGTIALSGSYATGGETWNLTVFPGVPVQTGAPVQVAVWGKAGYSYGYVPGSNLTNGKLNVMNGTTELTAGPYPGGVTSDVIQFEIILPKF